MTQSGPTSSTGRNIRPGEAARLVDNAAPKHPATKRTGEPGPAPIHNSERPTMGERMGVWWEILSVLTPVVCLALLGLIVLYAFSRAPRHRQ